MQKLQNTIYWLCAGSEVTHAFCCGIPMAFSILSLLSGMGLIASMPIGLDHLHHMMHDYELPMIATSGAIIVLGWALHYMAYRIDCRSTGCSHEPCAPKKKRSGKVLMIATILFAVNVSVYFTLHA